ncbi:DUF5362 family protein [Prosthecobacter sp.]|uniref:DUF5362 family protein n=1 Tax=Prosthecobacter sp. TaxID=1965333 RepID=UPI0024897941|nr:DUF5362 family protein [Prosthecobacter sp.]MDI1315154.1 DUF5362 family protein [Prosthecobacter sp.]
MESPLSNPYASPSANLYGSASGGAADAVSPSTIAQLAGTKPWVRFMSVLMWIAICLVILAIIAVGVAMTLGASKPIGTPELILIGVYGVMIFFYIYPAVKMWKFANRVKSLMATRSLADLDAALTEQRKLWKFVGVFTIIMLCIYLVAVIGFVALGAGAAMKSGAFNR